MTPDESQATSILHRPQKLAARFYLQKDVVQAAHSMLGKHIVTHIDQQITSGIITDVEAYAGENDKACHAHMRKVTARNKVMYEQGGCVYAYLCYGIHTLINIVTNDAGHADAILIRGIEPIKGIATIKKRRHYKKHQHLTDGPGKVAQALGVTPVYTQLSLQSDTIWIEDVGITPPLNQFDKLKRVGIDYAGEDAHLLWRFKVHSSWLADNKQKLIQSYNNQ